MRRDGRGPGTFWTLCLGSIRIPEFPMNIRAYLRHGTVAIVCALFYLQGYIMDLQIRSGPARTMRSGLQMLEIWLNY
jgi:hypothetical protein